MDVIENRPRDAVGGTGKEPGPNVSAAAVRACRWCLKQIPDEATLRRQYCGQSCRQRHASRSRYAPDDADGYGARLANWTCQGCGSPLDAGPRRQGARPRARCEVCIGPKLKSCPMCGAVHRRQSLACSTRCSRALRDRHFRRKDERRRRRVAESPEPFERAVIFERDSWVCQICGLPTDRTQEHPHPAAPVIDHVVPIAAGGEHLRSNVQCAHSRCNTLKGASLPAGYGPP